MLAEAKEASARFAREGNVEVSWDRLWRIDPRPFDPVLIDLCDAAIKETVPLSHRLPSGPLHDAAEVSGAGVPTVMMFVQSLHGISHNKIEDTREEHLAQCVAAFDRLAEKTMAWIAAGYGRKAGGGPVSFLAFISPGPSQEVGLAIGVVLTVAGTALHWQLPRQRMSAEERMKDGKLTEAQALRMIRLYTVSARLLTIAGAAVLVAILVELSR
jgi:hypothetical protein